ncbi:biotin carboxylase N-terminal domain-containing protein [Nocardioides lentus]|uniref:Biotin carboxylase N-terminal domain-containing protein n=1 Tax=Nocardioides lentus TaxID=338077 RepID=A0ABP5ABT7_9ACTN
MITRLLVANRGEIASRVFRTARRLGVQTVAVCSGADADLGYVAEADFVVRLPGATPAETYLDVDALLTWGEHQGADAVHPGYGFLAEDAGFARAVEAAGLTWVGPPPATIDLMGSKVAAKRHATSVGVPVLSVTDPTEADLPLLVKASAGGGGRGMRVVRDLADLPEALDGAAAEAAAAFGSGEVFVEPYVERGRHVEVQVWADGHGAVQVLGDRDCSVQRRHQKVVEEAPAPDLPDAVRAAMHAAALALTEPLGYRGVGTVELLYDADAERFWFLEMNTRLQVEHPVTEAVTGLDLVELQLVAAEGGTGPVEVPAPSGHAIEVRLYAEEPHHDHRPTTGRLVTFEVPREAGVRVDATYAAGDDVTPYYDGMLAKVVAHGPTRTAAARSLAGVLRRARIHGVATNRDQLVAVLTSEAFLAGAPTTAFLGEHPELSGPSRADRVAASFAATHAVVAEAVERRRDRHGVQHRVPPGWRNVRAAPQVTRWEVVGQEHPHEVAWVPARGGGIEHPSADLTVAGVRRADDGWRVDLTWEGVASWAQVVLDPAALPGHRDVFVDGPLGSVHLREVPRFTDPADAVASGSLTASMPGTVVRLDVAVGDTVTAGQPLLVLEAMKMQHTVSAPADGVVASVAVQQGVQVAAGEVLVVVETDEGPDR